MFQRPSDARFPNGAIIRGNQRIDKASSTILQNKVVAVVEDLEEEIYTYKPLQRADLGPIGKVGPTATLYDLFISNSPEIQDIRAMFHDWTFPEIVTVFATDATAQEKRVHPIRNFARGKVGSTGFHVDQYLYAIINHSLFPVQGFGTTDLMSIDRTSTLVCIKVVDPRIGNLGNSYVEYSVHMSTPISEAVSLAGSEMIDSERVYYANLNGDMAIEEAVSNDWFSTHTYKFNGVIYPLVSHYSSYDVDVKPYEPNDEDIDLPN